MTNTLPKKERVYRLFAVVLIYALILPDAISFGRSIESVSFEKSTGAVYTFSNDKTERTDSPKVATDELTSLNEESDEVQTSLESMTLPMSNAAASSGPGQGEQSGFSLNSTDGMVDQFTGDFSYSIPLMSVEGYPIVLSYNSNVVMNAEASWVGLGWDLNVGSVAREMRGIPDDFNGEQEVTKTINQLLNETENGYKAGLYVGFSNENKIFKKTVYPKIQFTALKGSYENTYSGKGYTFDFGLQSSASIGENLRFGPTFGLGWSSDSKNGIGRNVGVGAQLGLYDDSNNENGGGLSLTFGRNFNSRAGVTSKSIQFGANGSYIHEAKKTNIGGAAGYGASAVFPYGTLTAPPSVQFNTKGTSTSYGFDLGAAFKVGETQFVTTVGVKTMFYSSESGLAFPESVPSAKTFVQPAYGYLHSSKRFAATKELDTYPIMDFNRTNDKEFSETMKNAAFSFQTPDVFRASAMGLSATFRPRRSDVGTYIDPEGVVDIKGKSHSFSGELGFKGTTFTSVTLGYVNGTQKSEGASGVWEQELHFEQNTGTNTDAFDEATYFKQMGELTPQDMTVWNSLNGDDAAALAINEVSNELVVHNSLQNTPITVNSGFLNGANQEPVIATVFEPITAQEAALEQDDDFEYLAEGALTTAAPTSVPRSGGPRADNHISTMRVHSTGGSEYIYGIPAYTLSSSNVMFAVDNQEDLSTGLVRYDVGDNSVSNTKGRSGLYTKTTIPAYAHAFLLTEMHSPDYVDVSGDGPSIDDIGSYYKFNHTRIYGENNKFQYRYPISDETGSQAIFNEGFQGTDLDNTATYTYGEKEIWYTHSIESKNLIAEFYLEDREDAYGVTDEEGVLDTSKPLRALKKIVLYNRAERLSNPQGATPLQTVEFEYDYSLCRRNPANKFSQASTLDYAKSGKLTLRKIRVFAGASDEMGLAAYEFNYNVANSGVPQSVDNPDFNYAAVDAWGNYKENDLTRPNAFFPYAEQEEATANNNIQAWKLKEIINPAGGKTTIAYEADSYRAVQNKRPMRHMDISQMTTIFELLRIQNQGVWNGAHARLELSEDYASETALRNAISGSFWAQADFDDFIKDNFKKPKTPYTTEFGAFDLDFVPNNVIIFRLEEPLSTVNYATADDAGDAVKEAYFRTSDQPDDYMQRLFLKAHMQLKNFNGTIVTDLVPLFADISDDFVGDPFGGSLPFEDGFEAIGVMPPASGSNNYEYGYVVIDPMNSVEGERKRSKGDEFDNGQDKDKKKGVLLHPAERFGIDFARTNLPDRVYGICATCHGDLSIDRAITSGENVYEYMLSARGYAPRILPDYSTIRLYDADNVKYGGNARVKSIKYDDNWNQISGESDAVYKWNYFYPERAKTSGVASYEPPGAVDESDFYQWDTYLNVRKKFPDEQNFTPTPVTGALFPTPVVGHAKTIVRFSGEYDRGHSESEYFTAEDYPTVEDVTKIRKITRRANPVLAVVTGNTEDNIAFSQGFTVETNDFHGKPKQMATYNGNGDVQARSKYTYRDLEAQLPTIDRKGEVRNEFVGVEYDIHADSRRSTNSSTNTSIGGKLRIIFTGGFPILIPIPVYNRQRRIEEFYSHTLVKHINRTAIVERIETEQLGSVNEAQNLLFDRYNGSVLASSLTDEYDDPLYAMSYPAHWYYEELRDINSAEGKTYTGTIDGSALVPTTGAASDVYTPGDQLKITIGTFVSEAVVVEVTDTYANLILPNGGIYTAVGTGTATVEIVQTGRHNALGATMQQVTTKTPISVQAGSFNFPTQRILSSSALTLRDKNNVRCVDRNLVGDGAVNPPQVFLGTFINPFDYGARGDLVMNTQYAWQTERLNNSANHGTRFDGSFTNYAPLYALGTNGQWKTIVEDNHPNYIASDNYQFWRDLGHTERFDEFGKPVESEDQIDVSLAVLYGFNKELGLAPVAQAVNARAQEIAFDGFEDYSYYANQSLNYSETHFDFREVLTPGTGVAIDETVRHSGLASLRVRAGASATVNKSVGTTCSLDDAFTELNSGGTIPAQVFSVKECMCTVPFEPTAGEYVIGAWVKVGELNSTPTYTTARIDVSISGGTSTSFYPSGPIIDGWQRIEGAFTIPQGATEINVRLANSDASESAFFDDLRIHPFLAGMTTTVYDPKTLLPLATHDGYNFTTFYNYDENLNLVRVRVETREGIKTISESEFGTQKKFNN